MRAVALGGSLSENTLAIGIGEDVQQIEDVKCLTHLWRAVLGAGHGFTSACGWAFAGLMLVRPCVVTSMGDILTNGRRRATRSDAKSVTERVVRRHGVSVGGDRLNLNALFPVLPRTRAPLSWTDTYGVGKGSSRCRLSLWRPLAQAQP